MPNYSAVSEALALLSTWASEIDSRDDEVKAEVVRLMPTIFVPQTTGDKQVEAEVESVGPTALKPLTFKDLEIDDEDADGYLGEGDVLAIIGGKFAGLEGQVLEVDVVDNDPDASSIKLRITKPDGKHSRVNYRGEADFAKLARK